MGLRPLAHEFSLADVETHLSKQSCSILCTFDLDAVDQSFAPGVSAPNPDGLPATMWLDIAYLSGKSPQVTSMDVVELNPVTDVQHCTARLAALTVGRFLTGFAQRKV